MSCPSVSDVIVHPVGAVDGPAMLRRLVLAMHLDDGNLLVYEARLSPSPSGGREQVSFCFLFIRGFGLMKDGFFFFGSVLLGLVLVFNYLVTLEANVDDSGFGLRKFWFFFSARFLLGLVSVFNYLATMEGRFDDKRK